MNEDILHTIAGIAMTLAGFSGLVIFFRQQGLRNWSSAERRYLWFLIGDSFLVVLFALLPAPMLLAGWSEPTIWTVCSALLGVWFIVANLVALRGELRDKKHGQLDVIPFVTPMLYGLSALAVLIGVALWLSVFDVIVPRGQAIYVTGLLMLLALAALEFMFFVGRASLRDPPAQQPGDDPAIAIDPPNKA